TTTTTVPAETTTVPEETTTTTEAPVEIDCSVIGTDGQPMLDAGASNAEILAGLGPDWTSERDDFVLVDLEGYQYSCDGKVVFYGAWVAGEDDTLIFATSDHADFTDPLGVGPGMSLVDAVQLRGAATAGMNVENEQREFINFAVGNAEGWQYQGGSDSTGFAGIYSQPLSGYNETTTFVADAYITMIWWDPAPGSFQEPQPNPEQTLEELGYPDSGTITDLVQGDIACYATVTRPDNVEVTIVAGFEVCGMTDALGVTSQFTYAVGGISACESAEPCGQSETVWLLDGVVVTG
ncbi:MAG: hypothetical protein ACI9C1_004040, partial [Candidatus Aldehydirespiratoraceae bacterium]